jgi:hypothetical protein
MPFTAAHPSGYRHGLLRNSSTAEVYADLNRLREDVLRVHRQAVLKFRHHAYDSKGEFVTGKRNIQFRGARNVFVVLLGILLGLGAGLGTATAVPGGAASGFAVQAERAGLSSAQAKALQATVRARIAELGGEQIAPNKVRLTKDVTLTVVVPGEKYVRELDQPVGTLAACNYYYFCAYSGTYFSGDQINMYSCRSYSIPWVGNGSWDNNQSTGTRARMYNSAGSLIYTTPGARSYDNVGDWTSVYTVRNC